VGKQKGVVAMMNPFSKMRWGRVLLAGMGAAVLNITLMVLLIGVYIVFLGVQAQGAPDSAKIHQFATSVGQWGSPVFAALLTGGAAAWAARKVEAAPGLHGALIGLLVAIISLLVGLTFSDTLNPQMLVAFFLTIAAGGLGGALGAWQR
jgi:hypothetical protein